MKKIVSLMLVTLLCVGSLLGLNSCKTKGDHALDEFLSVLEDSNNNFTVTVEIDDVPLLGDMRITTHYDGKKQHTPAAFMTVEQYREYKLFVTYVYEKNSDGVWEKSKSDDVPERDYLDSNEAKILLNSENYDKTPYETGKYRQRAGSDMGEFKNAVLYVMDDAVIITATRMIDGAECRYSVRIWNVGNVEINLPNA